MTKAVRGEEEEEEEVEEVGQQQRQTKATAFVIAPHRSTVCYCNVLRQALPLPNLKPSSTDGFLHLNLNPLEPLEEEAGLVVGGRCQCGEWHLGKCRSLQAHNSDHRLA